MKNLTHTFLFACLLVSCSTPTEETNSTITNHKIVLSSDIKWEKLNPARGDKSPQAGTIWGDRKGEVATGFLAKFVDGFSSPPHIHNVTYRAIVLKGLIHNDDPEAKTMWMKPGSFWTQPKGESHITSAKGGETIAYVEIDQGPYLVEPINEAFDNGERPINIDVSNLVWLGFDQTNWIEQNTNAELCYLWGSQNDDNLKGLFIKLPSGFKGNLRSNGDIFHSVVVQGKLGYSTTTNSILDVGSYFSSTSAANHSIANDSNKETVLYIRTNGSIKIQ
ncbi:protein of unknown function [Reichenbachiella agariperforans]|uniref:DUF4437 domain-containing protein n=1 Tax=Reichenbachiella agariperforans TaxID=156994 RepID=A0A1M6Q7A0_REIAG|nr:DUF4437 domain-containing protein [Reichenbachiella agariperforans]SHK16071.1 protein of unknown function [Reichenbachiella agariperforans]